MGKWKGIKGQKLLLSCSGKVEPYPPNECKIHKDVSNGKVNFQKKEVYKATGRQNNPAICRKNPEVRKK